VYIEFVILTDNINVTILDLKFLLLPYCQIYIVYVDELLVVCSINLCSIFKCCVTNRIDVHSQMFCSTTVSEQLVANCMDWEVTLTHSSNI
jgi:hypothetical protein